MSTEATQIKSYEVTDIAGTVHKISSTFLFNNAGELTFRLGERGNSDVVGILPAGQWMNLVLKTEQPNGEQES